MEYYTPWSSLQVKKKMGLNSYFLCDRLSVLERKGDILYKKSRGNSKKNKKHPHCDKLECKLLNRLEDALVILLLFVKKLNFRHAKNLALEQV